MWTFQALRVCTSLYLDNPTAMHVNCQGKLMNGACALYQTSLSLNQYFRMYQSAHSLVRVICNKTCLKFIKPHNFNVSEYRKQLSRTVFTFIYGFVVKVNCFLICSSSNILCQNLILKFKINKMNSQPWLHFLICFLWPHFFSWNLL